MKLSARLDRPLYGPSGGRRYLWLRLEAPRRPPATDRPPLDIALVIDRSGSMAGDKIALARQAASRVAQLLRETDHCALVDYDDRVTVGSPITPVDESHRGRLATAIASIDARGNTDLFGGWLAGAEQLTDGATSRVHRVLLLTDGLANVGLTDPAEIQNHVRELNVHGVGTSTFGVGRDFDEFLLTGLAEAGGGHFYFVESAQQIPDYLSSELGELAAIVARDVTVGINVSGHARLWCINEVPETGGRFSMGDMSEAAIVDLFFALDVTPDNAGDIILTVNVAWRDAETNAGATTSGAVSLAAAHSDAEAEGADVDTETIVNVVKVRSARIRHHSLDLNRRGDFNKARETVEAELAELRTLAGLAPEAADSLGEMRLFAMEASSSIDPVARKKALFASYSRRHSRPDRSSE